MKLALALTLSAALNTTFVPVPGLNVNDLVAESDVVVAGHVVGSVDDGLTFVETATRRYPARRRVFDVRVSHAIKGSASGTVRVRMVEPMAESGYGYLHDNFSTLSRIRIMFFKRAADVYVPTSPYHPSIIAAPRDVVAGASSLAKVAAFVTAVLSAPGTTPRERKIAVLTLGRIKHSTAVAGLRIASADADPAVRIEALAERLEAGDTTALPLAESILLRNKPKVEWSDVVRILGSLRDTEWNEKAVPALQRLARSPDVLIRRYAIWALGNTASLAAVPALLRAMDDGDPEAQYNAVSSMARLTGALPLMTRGLFESRRAWYFTFWKDWARARGIAR